jgi:hypothetical protein
MEALNRSFGKFLRDQAHKSFLRSFTCGAPIGTPEYYQAHREYDRCTFLASWAELFYSREDEILDSE